MANFVRAKSIRNCSSFTEAISEYVNAANRVNLITDEASAEFRVAEEADLAAYDAVIAVIDAYCAGKITETIQRIQISFKP